MEQKYDAILIENHISYLKVRNQFYASRSVRLKDCFTLNKFSMFYFQRTEIQILIKQKRHTVYHIFHHSDLLTSTAHAPRGIIFAANCF